MIKINSIDNESKCQNCNRDAEHELKIGNTIIELCERCVDELKWQLS